MKRKFETLELPSTKKVKQDPKTTVLKLLEQHQSQLTMSHLKSVLHELTIEEIHELLILLLDKQILEKPGGNHLKQILFSHLFTMNYKDVGPSLQDLHALLVRYYQTNSLPRFPGRNLNFWLDKVNCDSSQDKNFHFILQILEVVVFGKGVDYANEIDSIDLDLINKRLSTYVETISNEKKDLANHIYPIICALGYITKVKSKGALETEYIDEMLSIFLNQNPTAEEVDKILYHLEYMLSRKNFKQVFSMTWVEKALLYMNEHADIETLFKRFVKITRTFCNTSYIFKPLQAKALQPIIDRMIEGNPTNDQLYARMYSLGMLADKKLLHGSIKGMDIFFEKLRKEKLTTEKLIGFLYSISWLTPFLQDPLPADCVEKFLIPSMLQLDKKNLSVAFHTFFILGHNSKLFGQLTGNFLTLIDFVANSPIATLDEKLVISALSALGACLPHINRDESQIVDKLVRQLTQFKIKNTSSLVHAFNTFKDIALSKNFKGVFRGKDMTLLLEKFRTIQPNNAHVAICAYNLGIVARQGYLEGTVSQKTLNEAQQTLLSFTCVKPTVLLKCLIAFSDLKTKNALHDLESETILDRLISHTRVFNSFSETEKTILEEFNATDVEVVLQLPYQLRAKVLNIILPLCLYILDCKPDIKAIKAFNRAIDEQIETKSLARIPAQAMADILAIYLKLNQFYPKTFANIFTLVVKLSEAKLLEGEVILKNPSQHIQKIFNEYLFCQPKMTDELSFMANMLDSIDFLYDKFPGKLDILPAVFMLLARNLENTPDLESIADIFQSVQNLLDVELIVFRLIKDQILEEILQTVINLASLQKDQLLQILEGLSCLIDYQLIDGHVDATIIDKLLARMKDFDPEGLDEKLLDIFGEYNQSKPKNPKPRLSPQQFFYHDSEEKPSEAEELSLSQSN